LEIKPPDHEDEFDARIRELFRAAGATVPSPDFVSRTMNAVRVAPLPAGRVALRHPWSAPIGWVTLVAAASVLIYATFVIQPIGARMFASILSVTLRAGAHSIGYVAAGLAVSELLATVGRAVARAAATREGTTTLLLTAAVAVTSLLTLQRLLLSGREDAEWQELS
jgi:hypothetical protein